MTNIGHERVCFTMMNYLKMTFTFMLTEKTCGGSSLVLMIPTQKNEFHQLYLWNIIAQNLTLGKQVFNTL